MFVDARIWLSQTQTQPSPVTMLAFQLQDSRCLIFNDNDWADIGTLMLIWEKILKSYTMLAKYVRKQVSFKLINWH